MAEHKQILLKNVHEPNQNQIESAMSRGAYSILDKALGMDPLKIIDEVKASQLRGRGGAGFPTTAGSSGGRRPVR